MRLVEVRLVQCGAAPACYQPITGQAWQSWGLGEEGGGGGLITITAHAQCGPGEGGVVLLECVCVCVCVDAEGGLKHWVGGCLTPFLFLRPRGDHTLFVLYFCTTWLADFFLFKHFSSPLPPLAMWAAFLPSRKGKTAVAVPSSSPLTKELCKQEIQIRCRWVKEPGSSRIPLPSEEKGNLTGASRLQPHPALQSAFKSGDFSPF